MLTIPQASHNRLTWVVCGWFVWAAALAGAQEPTPWKTGAAFRRQLDELTTIGWKNRPIRDGLARLTHESGVAIFLDRRIDPGLAVTITAREQPLDALLNQVAAEADARTAVIASVVYIGPRNAAPQIATLAALRRQEVEKLPSEAKARLLRAEAWQWDELAQPRQLTEDLARQASVTIANLDVIPLDLWPAARLPPLAWIDRLTLVLAGFGLTFDIDTSGSIVRLVPQPSAVVLEKRYTPRGNAANLAAELRRITPEAGIRVEQDELIVSGSQEDHAKIERLVAGQSLRTVRRTKVDGEKLYSLQVPNQPAESVVRKMAEVLGKELKCDPVALEKLKQRVTYSFQKVSADHLLETTLKPLGLTYHLTADTLEIVTEP